MNTNETATKQYCTKTGKICFGSKEALQLINSSKKHYCWHSGHKIPKRAYFCSYCKSFHLTSKKRTKSEVLKRVKDFRQK